MQSLAVYLYVTAVGFVTAGVLASFVQLVSGEPMRFNVEPKSPLVSIGGVLLRVLAGPAHSHAQRVAGLAAAIASESLVRGVRGDRRGLEPAVGRVPARPDPEAVTASSAGKKEPASWRGRLQ